MNRFQASVAILGAALLFGLAAVALANADENKDKEKPKDAPVLDDRTATLTEVVDGKEKKTKIELKHALMVKGYFAAAGFHIEEVDADGPAARMSDAAGNEGVAMMEKGDVVTEVDGKRIKSASDYAKAMNGAKDPAKIKVKVRDVNTGREVEFYADAAKR
jgi:S1-C subfamily serine protease